MSNSAAIQNVALAGATGYLGARILSALLTADFTVTVLARPSSTAPLPPGLRVVHVDFSSVPALTAALQGQDAFVSAVPTVGTEPHFRACAQAAVAARVRRYVPSDFGADTSLAAVRALPAYADKPEAHAALREAVAGASTTTTTTTTYTLVYCNAFLDYALDYGAYLDLRGKKIRMFDGGDVRVTTSPTDFVARGVVAILRNLDATANRAVRLQGAVVTQRQLWGYAKKYLDDDGWEVEEVMSEDEGQRGREKLAKDPEDVWGWMWPMLLQAQFGEGYSRNFDHNNDNALLGLEEISEADVEGYVKRSIDAISSTVI